MGQIKNIKLHIVTDIKSFSREVFYNTHTSSLQQQQQQIHNGIHNESSRQTTCQQTIDAGNPCTPCVRRLLLNLTTYNFCKGDKERYRSKNSPHEGCRRTR